VRKRNKDPIAERSFRPGLRIGLNRMNTELANRQLRIIRNLEKDTSTETAHHYSRICSYSSSAERPIHRWFKFREGYSLDLIIDILSDGFSDGRILDPFCGCGTTLLAAKMLGHESIGIDINPLAVFVAKVKTDKYTNKEMSKLEEMIGVLSRHEFSNKDHDIPNPRLMGKAFHPDILSALVELKGVIDKSFGDNRKTHNLLFLCWLSTIEPVSYTFKEGNGIKYRYTKRTKNGYISVFSEEWIKHNYGKNEPERQNLVLHTFIKKLREIIYDLRSSKKSSIVSQVREDDSRLLSDLVDEKTISTALFSPPYVNCFDYTEIYKIELWLGSFVKSRDELKILRQKAVRSNLNADLNAEYQGELRKDIRRILELMDIDTLWSKKIPGVVMGYFEDMRQTLSEIKKVLAPGGRCGIVIGNSAYSGVLVPTDILIAKIASELGYNKINTIKVRKLTTSSQQRKALEPLKEYLRESIVFFNRPGKLMQSKRTEKEESTKIDELPIYADIKNDSRFLVTSNNVSYLTHIIHKYPAKFIPQIPRWAIMRYLKENQVVLDPFCGSGTTLVEAIIRNHTACGIDIDPLARLVTKVKTTPLNENRLNEVVVGVLDRLKNRPKHIIKPSIPTLGHWFKDTSVKELGHIRSIIEDYKSEKDIYDFLMVTFSSIIRKASNADDQSQKTYVSHTKIKDAPPPKPLFQHNLLLHRDRIIQLNKTLHKIPQVKIFDNIDAREFSCVLKSADIDSVDLCVTSPPYIKAIDYIYDQMVEYFWIGDLFNLETQHKQNRYKVHYVGTKQVEAKIYKNFLETGFTEIDCLSAKIYKISPKHSYITSKYFLDVLDNFREVNKVLKKKAHYIFVVGDCHVSDIPVKTHSLLFDVAETVGFRIHNQFCYEIRNRYMRFPRKGRGGLIKDDWILDLVKE